MKVLKKDLEYIYGGVEPLSSAAAVTLAAEAGVIGGVAVGGGAAVVSQAAIAALYVPQALVLAAPVYLAYQLGKLFSRL